MEIQLWCIDSGCKRFTTDLVVMVMINRLPQDRSFLTGSVTPPAQPRVPRWIWVLLMLLAAAIISGIAGLLSHAAGNNVPAAILTGGGAFAGTFALLLAVAHYTGTE
jgi:hypothetical protein